MAGFKAIGIFIACGAIAAAAGFMRLGHAAEDDPPPRSSARQPLDVSIIQLIARPDDFHGEYVRVIGFYRTEFEGTAVYLHREDYAQGLRKNGLWVTRNFNEHDMQYVLIEGRFDATRRGHRGLWSGTIDDVGRIMTWPPRRNRRAGEDREQDS